MIIKAGEAHKIQRIGTVQAPVKSSTTTGNGGNELMVFTEQAVSALQSVLTPSVSGADRTGGSGTAHTARVKFMITMQDEEDLRKLGYSQAEIDKIKPQEAMDILQAGRKKHSSDLITGSDARGSAARVSKDSNEWAPSR